MSRTIHVLGANGRTGVVLCCALLARGAAVVPVVRTPARWQAFGLPGTPRVADFNDAGALAAALHDAGTIINVSYAGFTGAILDAAPAAARLVLVGTARRYGPLDNPPAEQAAAAEALLRESGRDAVMLHPTMIYGAPDDGTIRRLEALIRRMPVLPLPGGGRRLVQPIHVDDLAAALIAAADRGWPAPTAFAAAGPEAVTYAGLIRAIARATGRRAPLIVPIPVGVVQMIGRGRPGVLRWLADRDADISVMRRTLGVTGRALDQGLTETFRSERDLGRTTGLEPATSKTTTWRSTN